MAANQYKARPADKVYAAANGHTMEVSPQFSKHSGWYFVYAFAGHSDSCWCHTSEEGNYNVGEYAGEEE
jgi:hypothetical protein